MTKNPPTAVTDVEQAVARLGVVPPSDYLSFMAEANGAEGPVGEGGYLVLWSMDQIAELNAAYSVNEFAPELVLFGSDGGDTGFAFDKTRPGRVVSVPFVGMSAQHARDIAGAFHELLEQLSGS